MRERERRRRETKQSLTEREHEGEEKQRKGQDGERGEKKEETFTTQSNFLIQNNFEIIGINYEWKRGLFLNKKYISE